MDREGKGKLEMNVIHIAKDFSFVSKQDSFAFRVVQARHTCKSLWLVAFCLRSRKCPTEEASSGSSTGRRACA